LLFGRWRTTIGVGENQLALRKYMEKLKDKLLPFIFRNIFIDSLSELALLRTDKIAYGGNVNVTLRKASIRLAA
jgi:hypothetical protein